jgi:AraC family transcriptional regulator, regulatory protein of adaptative response / methylated-DNA-[protein]-cysteine methyltransferase
MDSVNTTPASLPNGATLPGYEPTSKQIATSTRESALGIILVARSANGVCAILIGSEVEQLRRDLAAQLPNFSFVRDDAMLDDDLKKIQRFIETPAEGLDLRLDIRGTAFQRRVWTALLGVPAGSTVTYAALAARIGEPGSARAVASACAANAVALAIPCHRVIRKDGTLSGYRWGVERKRALLAREGST